MRRKLWLTLNIAAAFAMLLTPLSSGAVAPSFEEKQPPPPAAHKAPLPSEKAPAPVLPTFVSREEALAKIHPDLRKLAETAAPALPGAIQTDAANPTVLLRVVAKPGTDLSAYMSNIMAANVVFEGEQDIYGQAPASNIIKIASLADVMSIYQVVLEKNGAPPVPPEDQPAKPALQDWATLRANADKLREGALPWDQAKAFGDGRADMQPADWFEVSPAGPHKAETAWARGFDGTGVVVEVNDDGVDWAHPDLMGRQKIYSTTNTSTSYCGPKGCAGAYNGWPMVYSPFSQYMYVYDSFVGTSYIPNGQSGIHYADTTAMPTLTPCGTGLSCFTFAPLLDYGVHSVAHTYVISSSMSKSGVVHVGTHPDENLRDYVWGEKVSVLVTDPNVAGQYDTVYVDLDDDYDFRNEKPLKKADTTNDATLEATKNNMIAYRDMNGDGKADLSGGALYFIADGVTPIPFSWLYWGAGLAPAPGNGDLVAFDGPWDSGESHGTLCASDVVGQGQVNELLPAFSDLPGNGKPAGAVFGAAKNARLVDVSNIYWDFDNSKLAAYTFAVYGYDGQRSTLADGTVNAANTDGIQMTSNSYGSSNQDNDGWEYDGRYVSRRVRLYGRYLSMLFSTGNGAPAFGTTSPPSPDIAIGVGASTQYGSTGWDSITSTTQIMNNDVAWYSNRGPGARGTAGVDVVADGQRGAGDLNLNYSVGSWGLNGNNAWVTWGGTSRSAPAAMGNLALLYQAFYAKNGRWPWYDEAKALFKSTSTDLNYGTLTQGAGSVNADRGTLVAGGWYGLYVTPDEWDPGDYRGVDYPAFAHVMTPTQTVAKTFTVNNTGITTITASIVDGNPTLIGSKTFTYSITPAMYAALSTDTFQSPQMVIPITATASKIISNSWWSNITIPSGTQLMLITMRYPLSQFDANGDYAVDNHFRLVAYNWKDVNGDGYVWHDKNSNGVVNYSLSSNYGIDGPASFYEPNWSDPANEIDRWEYGRFDYARPYGNVLQLPIHDPVSRMQDGLFIGLQQYPGGLQQTDFTFRIDFYQYQPVPWLSVSDSSLEVAPGASETFVVTATTNNTSAGIYEAAIKIADPGATVSGVVTTPGGTVVLPATAFPAHTTVVPVAMSVAPDYVDGMQFGGAAQAAAQANSLYNNAVVRGYQDWSWRAESGDWRFFFFDNKSTPAPGAKLLVKDEWADAAPHTDIDTIVMGPTLDDFSPGGPYSDTTYYGPYTLDTKGKSPNTNSSAGIWSFNTSSGGAEDWVTAPFTTGLHLLAEHNVLFEGDKFDVVFTKTVGTIQSSLQGIELYTYLDSGTQDIVLQSTLPLPGMTSDGYGLGGPDQYSWLVPFTGPGTIEFTYDFTVTHAAKIDITTSSPDISDIDIYLYRWTGTAWSRIASSAGGTADEHILVVKPADGMYRLGIDNYSGPAGTVDATIVVVQGNDLSVSGTTTSTIPVNTPITLTVAFNKAMKAGDKYEGVLLLGPTTAPGALEIPVTIRRLASSAMLQKSVDYSTGFPGLDLNYTLDLFNLSDSAANWSFTDPIPAGTSFVTATGSVCAPAIPVLQEGFEGTYPPTGWAVYETGDANPGWLQGMSGTSGSHGDPHSGTYFAWHNDDIVTTNAVSWLVTKQITVPTGASLSFWERTYWNGYANYHGVWISTGSGDPTGGAFVELSNLTGSKPTVWTQHTLDLSAYAGQSVYVAFRFEGNWDDEWYVDDVNIAAPAVCQSPVYDAANNRVIYTGTLPLGAQHPYVEGFEGGAIPAGWSTLHLGATTWEWTVLNAYPHTGAYHAWVRYDSAAASDEWLFSPWFTPTLSDKTLSFWAISDTDYPGATMTVYAIDAGGTFTDTVWDLIADETWTGSFAYHQVTRDLSAYVGQSIRLAWRYHGLDGESFGLDDILFPGSGIVYVPSAVFNLTVHITDTIAAGSYVTNTGALVATHTSPQPLPQGKQTETTTASATTHIGMADFATSYKEASAEAATGGNITYMVHVKNTGDKLESVTLTDPIPAHTSYSSHDVNPPYQHFEYDAANNEMKWVGNVAPGEELIFTFAAKVDADPTLWGTTLTNTASIMVGSSTMPMSASTKIVPPYKMYLPMVFKQ